MKRYVEQAHKPSSMKENGSNDVHELKQQGQPGDSAAKDVPNGNPRESERKAQRESRNFGEVTDFQLQKSVINATLE